jgi:hypothetical protein
MNDINISGSVFGEDLLQIEKLFEYFGNLEKGCFCIYKRVYSDESFSLWFNPPTDMTPDAAENLVAQAMLYALELKE